MADQASVIGHASAPQDPAPQEQASQRRMLPRVIGARRGGLLAVGGLAAVCAAALAVYLTAFQRKTKRWQ